MITTHQLLLLVGVDANGKSVPLAAAIVESESAESWKYLLRHAKARLGEQYLNGSNTVVMSDRSKGLEKY